MGKGCLLELVWNYYDTDCAAVYATRKRIRNMVVTDKNELQAQKEPRLPDEEELYDRYVGN